MSIPAVHANDLLAQVTIKFRIPQRECLRQAYEYANHRISPAELAVKIDQYFRYGAYDETVKKYAEGILSGVIKI